ncbi:MAG: hypothetical protein JJU05_06830 [Verrucomicrobia bacterium]|nr:hypothetical protein [Verrucomicrobiota bacterium]MCH8527038.1 hypothetical protein [Kiritimatiellia bacterium]
MRNFHTPSSSFHRLFSIRLFLLLLFHMTAEAQQVFTPDPAMHIRPDASWPRDRPLGVRLVSPRNSSATGAVVITDARGPVTAEVSPLQPASGGPAFPANLVTLRYGFEGMHPEPREGNTQVIWITAEVPPAAPPGEYRGEISLRGSGTVPVLLEVGEWAAPRPSRFATHQSYIQSPHNIKRYYDVDLWSDEHFERLDASLTQLGRLGSNVMYLPATGETHFGNRHTIVRYSGSVPNLEPDFSALERYLHMWDKRVGAPNFIILYMHESGRHRRRNTMKVTSAPRGGGGEQIEVPLYTEPQGPMLNVWRQTFAGILQRVQALGWNDTQVLLGIVGDNRDFGDMKDFFSQAAPGIRWKTFTHGRGDPTVPTGDTDHVNMSGLDFGMITFPYNPRRGRAFNSTPPDGPGNWHSVFPFLTSFRNSFAHNIGDIETVEPFFWRYKAMGSVLDRYNGFSRMGFDFIRVDGALLMGQYHRWNNLTRNNPRYLVYPGPEGILSTQAVEMSVEGNAMAQAFIVLHDALTLEDQTRQLSSDLKNRAEAVRDDIYDQFQSHFIGSGNDLYRNLRGQVNTDWQTPLRELYDVAGEVSRELGLDTAPAGPTAQRLPAAADRVETRQWTSADGRSVQAGFQGFANGQVGLVMPNGQTAAVPLESLSRADQDWVRETVGIRLWRNPEGQGIHARLLDFDGETAHLENEQGEAFELPLNVLHPEEQQHLLENHTPENTP